MEAVLDRCAGLDVHKRTVVACAITPEGKETRTFGTMTDDLQQLGAWLQERGISEVAMESSGEAALTGNRSSTSWRTWGWSC